jgi:hypothetical protein
VTKQERINQDVLHRRAQVAVLSGLVAGDDVYDLMAAAAPTHVPGSFTPGVALLKLAVTALDLACPAGAESPEYKGLRERYVPEVTFRGRVEHRNSQSAPYTAACMPGGLQPDLLSDADWWQIPLWQYAVFAAVIYSRAPRGSRGGDRSADRRWHGLEFTRDHLWSRGRPREGEQRLPPGRLSPPGVTHS